MPGKRSREGHGSAAKMALHHVLVNRECARRCVLKQTQCEHCSTEKHPFLRENTRNGPCSSTSAHLSSRVLRNQIFPERYIVASDEKDTVGNDDLGTTRTKLAA